MHARIYNRLYAKRKGLKNNMPLKDGKSTLDAGFLGSCGDYDSAEVIMVGVPMDMTCSFRPGARFGPQRIRQVSAGLEEYSIYIDGDLRESGFCDCGDLDLPYGDLKGCLEKIGEAAREIAVDGKFPLFVGGEHLISVPVVKSLYEKYGEELIVIQLDAHADLRESYLGLAESHASAVRRIMDFIPGRNIFQLGIRSGTKDEFEFAKNNTNLYMFEVLKPLEKVAGHIGQKPVYVTLDIDVLDPSFANGTGTPEPGGVDSKELLKAVCRLGGFNLVGFDLVEVSPPYDASDRTALIAAKIIREVVIMKGKKTQKGKKTFD